MYIPIIAQMDSTSYLWHLLNVRKIIHMKLTLLELFIVRSSWNINQNMFSLISFFFEQRRHGIKLQIRRFALIIDSWFQRIVLTLRCHSLSMLLFHHISFWFNSFWYFVTGINSSIKGLYTKSCMNKET